MSNSFALAYVKLRSIVNADVLVGLDMMYNMMELDDFNREIYVYNIMYGYYRLDDFDKFNKIYEQNSFFGLNSDIKYFKYLAWGSFVNAMPMNSVECKYFLPVAVGLLCVSGILLITRI